MSAVISDTSPINYLVLIGEIELLPSIFGAVLIPPAVLQELLHPKAPPVIREWATHLPNWVTIASPKAIIPDLDLDVGETQAISLAKDHPGSLLIIDERKGRKAASRIGILTAGTLNLLEEADRRILLRFDEAIAKLRRTNFRIDEKVLDEFLLRLRSQKPTS